MALIRKWWCINVNRYTKIRRNKSYQALPALNGSSLTNLPALQVYLLFLTIAVGSFSFIRRIVGHTSKPVGHLTNRCSKKNKYWCLSKIAGTWRNMTGFLLEGQGMFGKGNHNDDWTIKVHGATLIGAKNPVWANKEKNPY